MTVGPRDRALVQQSLAAIAPSGPAVPLLFYRRLFELDPALRPMFPDDLREQQAKLIQMLAVAVRGLDRPEELIAPLEELGRRHRRYGVDASQYETIGTALLDTLRCVLGDAFTADVCAAWALVYGMLSGVMIRAAASSAA